MEYYGAADQVYYEVYVSSETPFNTFDFDGYTYRYVHSKCCIGIENVKYSGGIRKQDTSSGMNVWIWDYLLIFLSCVKAKLAKAKGILQGTTRMLYTIIRGK